MVLAWGLALALAAVQAAAQVEVVRVERADGGRVSASVVDAPPEGLDGLEVRMMRYGDCILGAQFKDEAFEGTSPFTAFNLMAYGMERVAAEQGPAARRMLQLGLGVGSVPRYAKDYCGFDVVEAVENSTVVKELAQEYFGYRAGPVHLADAHAFLHEQSARERFDFVAQDLYLGWNPTHMLRKEVFQRVREHWLDADHGVYLVNFVGFHEGEHSAFSGSLVWTLRQVFAAVRCFRDSPLNHRASAPSNIICFASDRPDLVDFLDGGSPDPALAHLDIAALSLPWLRDNFAHWEVFQDPVGVQEIASGTDLAPYRASFAAVSEQMAAFVRPLLPEDLWDAPAEDRAEDRAEL